MLFETGLLNRRRVLGDAWVDKSLAGRTPLNADFQAMTTCIAWNEIWDRSGLDDRTLLVLAMTASLGRPDEFALHVRAEDLAEIPIKALVDRNPSVDRTAVADTLLGCAS